MHTDIVRRTTQVEIHAYTSFSGRNNHRMCLTDQCSRMMGFHNDRPYRDISFPKPRFYSWKLFYKNNFNASDVFAIRWSNQNVAFQALFCYYGAYNSSYEQ